MDRVPNNKLTKIFSYGTDSPFINRMTVQFLEMFKSNAFNIPQPNLDQVQEILFDCGKNLVHIQETVTSYIQIEDNAIRQISSGEGLNFQPNAVSYEDPTSELYRLFEDFLMRSNIVLRKKMKLAELILNVKLENKRSLLKEQLRKEFSHNPKRIEWLENDSEWLIELVNLRNDTEHEELEVSNFEVEFETGNPIIHLSKIKKNNCLVREYMNVSLFNVFTHMEDFVALLLSARCSKPFEIHPLRQADDNRESRYILDLEQSSLRSLFETIQKDLYK